MEWRRAVQEKELVLGLALLNIFVSDMDSAIECIIRRLANDSKLHGPVNRLEGKDAIQRDLDKLVRWDCEKLFKFNKAKCKVLHLDRGNPKYK
ncbi:hypothetical protein HGM15179_010746 [Zosterops borbonicus]|uniref:Rna-directed dna polymerase from mobile element jockey-like n=1 Tax=Zosterops borbonicus TaxID=364589 RepID=A0A8K1GE05_9PASS|nr:hypothetical protein HGM15179_010746 [Zosterops borbonicus]